MHGGGSLSSPSPAFVDNWPPIAGDDDDDYNSFFYTRYFDQEVFAKA